MDGHRHDGPLAVGTTRREDPMVVFVTVRPAVPLKEARGAQLRLARLAHKVLGVPHLTQRRDHLQEREGGE